MTFDLTEARRLHDRADHAPIAEPLQRTHIDRDGDTW